MTEAAPITYLLVDGENLDGVLGSNILGHRPLAEDRPRWDRVVTAIRNMWETEVRGLFFINATNGFAQAFVQALHSMKIRPVLLKSSGDVKVVDEGILRTLAAIRDRPGNVVLGSHDGDFLDSIEQLLDQNRKVAILGFTEHINAQYLPLKTKGLEIVDMEDDALAFNRPLDRIRIIDLEDFDPLKFL